ncbi:hypothetical protein [Helicobacter pylori]|uniref:hypothetical protein n=1 Tax=Helicobacter pylori TaxID=210 RepID=UPI0018D19342|nr:hypothetical protein [Helicobacter pylori]MBH0287853.1 hypothetical protein [Helicobacter pylori]MBH0290694.1 hypothetical protein [Helicobacter pylori]
MWRSLDPTNTPKLSFSEPFNQQQFQDNKLSFSEPFNQQQSQDNKPALTSTIGTTTNYGKLNYIKIGLNQNFNANVGANQDSPFLTSFLKSFL